jgi:hypothetical protein
MQRFCNTFASTLQSSHIFVNKIKYIYSNKQLKILKFMDELESIKKRRATEHQQGDVRKACERAGVSSTIFQSALRKSKIDDLTDKEMKVLLAFRDVLDERMVQKNMLRSKLI